MFVVNNVKENTHVSGTPIMLSKALLCARNKAELPANVY